MSQLALVQPFQGWRPLREHVSRVAAPPYDVLNSDEARAMAEDNPYSFLRVSKAEINLPVGTSPYDAAVYQKAAENFAALKQQGILVQDPQPCYYVYRLIMDGRAQTGVVAAASVQAYDSDRIKKHEFTRPDKENDRTEFAWQLKAHSGPVFLTYRHNVRIDNLVNKVCAGEPIYDFTAPDGIQHTLWVSADAADNQQITEAFDALAHVYVADGHHRSAAASRVHRRFVEEGLGRDDEEAPHNRFLSVLFPDNQMRILDYNRVVKDLGGLSRAAFLERLGEAFEITPQRVPCTPNQRRTFGMYLEGVWYKLVLKAEIADPEDPTKRLDVSLLSDHLLAPILGIEDLRRDARIDFVGGIRGMAGLMARVDSGEMAVAFSMCATTMDDLMAVADDGQVMPPKSTWFEPKLRDGLVTQGF
ncbi:Uncharacterized conserved protein UCP033563 [Magnetococcus marinus MC-1]|uniref:Uncharacterized conserved protein UCP033563 n=1 Tax=Magnetococcus marinus (strain ATCC BAA-1437 / JCM 17883 / MC-1) TaxID=156889 RepID=A0L8Z1_MAGMM|nr:DUF1015 family protein [Magnetococcus marinus]ABK44434.1 Uncharacterized conserved protein UCP033563 [Magnetococcus marinus MC-1]